MLHLRRPRTDSVPLFSQEQDIIDQAVEQVNGVTEGLVEIIDYNIENPCAVTPLNPHPPDP